MDALIDSESCCFNLYGCYNFGRAFLEHKCLQCLSKEQLFHKGELKTSAQ